MGILEYFFTIMQKIKVLPIEYYRILYVVNVNDLVNAPKTGENRVTFFITFTNVFLFFFHKKRVY